MKKLTFISIIFLVASSSIFSACKVKRQAITDDQIQSQSTSKTSAEKQTIANLMERTTDSSKIVKKDSALISTTEKEDIEYDYPTPIAGKPSKIVHHIEKTTNFQTGSNITNQKNVKSGTTAELQNNENKNAIKITDVAEDHHSAIVMTSSSVSWIWIGGSAILLAILMIYLMKRFNLLSLIRSTIAKII